MGVWTERAKAVKAIMELGKLINEIGITVDEKPADPPSRPGYKWKPIINVLSKKIGWQEVEDPDAQGTADNPIPWEPGMEVHANYYYTSNGVRYVCVQNGNPTEISTEYFEEF